MTHTEDAINNLVRNWYRALDTHEPVATLQAMLDPAGPRMIFPEATLTGPDAFTDWYEGVIRIFFDEVHQVERVTIDHADGDTTDIRVVVRWEASRWHPPAARSERIMLFAYQSWTLRTGPDGTQRIASYTVDRLEYLPGSALL